MHKQNDRALSILTTNGDPLVDAADFGEKSFVNAPDGVNQRGLGEFVTSIGSVGETSAEQESDKYREAQQSELRYIPNLARRAHRTLLRNAVTRSSGVRLRPVSLPSLACDKSVSLGMTIDRD